jgi:hypothetical protein
MYDSPVRKTVRRTFTVEYDVHTDYYDSSYTDADVMRLEMRRSLRNVVTESDYELTEDSAEFREVTKCPSPTAGR